MGGPAPGGVGGVGGSGPAVYVALGDSYTLGLGASSRGARGFVPLVARSLATALGRLVSVKNLAGPDFSSDEVIRTALPSLETLAAPDFVTVLVGARDVVDRRSRDDYRGSLAWIYDTVAGRVPAPSHVACLSIPDWSLAPAASGGSFGDVARVRVVIEGMNAVARGEAAARGFSWVDLVPVSRSRAGSADWFAEDGLLPSQIQYAAWAEAIWGVVGEGWAADSGG